MTRRPDLSADALLLRADVAALAPPEGRHPGTDGHRKARDFLAARMREAGLEPYRGDGFALHYRAFGRDFYNMVGEIPGARGAGPPILVAAHYDSVIQAPCADDNAAGVAIALDIARRLSPGRRTGAGVVFAFFDAEEPPWFLSDAMGSIRFFHDQMRPEGVQTALVMDLVGHDVPVPVFEQAIFVTGAESHPALPGVLDTARAGVLPVVAAQNRLVGDLSDHHVFREHGFPYLFFSCGHWAHYHKPSDTPDRLSYEKMDRIRALLQGTIQGLVGLDLPKAKGEGDTTAFEIRLLSEAAGEALPLLLRAVGVQKLETRRDMDAFARAVQGQFGL